MLFRSISSYEKNGILFQKIGRFPRKFLQKILYGKKGLGKLIFFHLSYNMINKSKQMFGFFGGGKMTKIPFDTRDLMEKAIYYPMVIKVLERDLYVVEKSPFKLRKPYQEWIEKTMQAVQKELFFVKREMKKEGLKVEEVKRDDTFTTYLFIYKGYEEYHNYFNPRLRNRVEELLAHFLFKRFFPDEPERQALRTQ